jgi:rhodanese-related sulfurtransferase
LAAKALLDIGIEVAHMTGGFSEWQQSGLPVEAYKRK